jgi:hypothetical protein
VDSLFSIAVVHLFELGIHSSNLKATSGGKTERTARVVTRREHYRSRTLFWLCYIVDKDLCIRTGRPAFIDDECCDLTVPCYSICRRYINLGLKSSYPNDQDCDLYPTDLRLSIIKSRIYKGLYSAEAMRKSDSALIRMIRELDEELELWRLFIRQPDRPTLFVSRITLRQGLSATRAVMLQLEYYRCLIMIHQASTRFWTAAKSNTTISQALTSSLRLCLEASRSTVSYLEAASYLLHRNVFWYVIGIVLFNSAKLKYCA